MIPDISFQHQQPLQLIYLSLHLADPGFLGPQPFLKSPASLPRLLTAAALQIEQPTEDGYLSAWVEALDALVNIDLVVPAAFQGHRRRVRVDAHGGSPD